MDPVRVHQVTKTYRVGLGRARVREMLPRPFDALVRRGFPRWWNRHTFNALEDVSFSVSEGASLGIVGHNGAGKTTLLKVIAGVCAPSRGSVEVTGGLGALIDVLVGFHPELTGRENVYLLGAIYGFGRREMTKRLDDILAFSEIEGELVDTPVKRYSTGTVARLGFSVTTALGLNVLLVDEVLAVGDASFQQKCISWLESFRAKGGTLLFVSHNLSLIRNMTEEVLWLDHGRVEAQGLTGEVLPHYARAMGGREATAPSARMWEADKAMRARGLHRWGVGGASVQSVEFDEPTAADPGACLRIRYEAPELDRAFFCVGFLDEGSRELGASTSPALSLKDEGVIRCEIRPLPFRPGIYFPVIAILSPDGRVRDRWRLDRALVVERNGDGYVGEDFGPVAINAVWEH
jgi:ABC-type polysaccharide/polyol phosphate transport system ATPase subunit